MPHIQFSLLLTSYINMAHLSQITNIDILLLNKSHIWFRFMRLMWFLLCSEGTYFYFIISSLTSFLCSRISSRIPYYMWLSYIFRLFWAWQLLRFSLFIMTLTVLVMTVGGTEQVFCRISLNLALFVVLSHC